MHSIKITEDVLEMTSIAKEIVKSKPNIYTEKVFQIIRDTVCANLKNASEEIIEEMMWRTIYYYWVYGCTVDEFFFYKFMDKSHEEIKEYVTAHERMVYIDKLNKKEDSYLLDNKWETYKIFKDYYKRDVILLKDENDYTEFCEFVDKHSEFVVKPVDMALGNGVHKENAFNMSNDERYELFKKILSEVANNKTKYNRGSEVSILLEEVIRQDEEMARIHPGSVNGVRITTVRVGDKVHIYHPWFKVGRNGKFVTSAAYGSFDAGIDPKTGIVVTPGVTEMEGEFEIHPDTNIPILGFQIPKWKDAIDMVTELAMQLPTISYVGWDIALTSKGWVIIEGNFKGSFMWQLVENRGSKKEFEELIGWKLEKDFWWRK